MANFPELDPATRVFTSPQRVVTLTVNQLGRRYGLQHSNGFTGGSLSLSFVGLTDLQVLDVLGHHNYHGDFYPFDLPSSITAGSTIYQPAGHKWTYFEPPTITRANGLNDAEVTLSLVQDVAI